jgi:protease IV
MLDPFSPNNPEQTLYAHKMLEEVHQNFIQAVKEGRGNRLKSDPALFTGLVWTGTDAKKLGLIDGFKSTEAVARDLIGSKRCVNYTQHQSFFDKMANTMGTTFGQAIFSQFLGGLHALQ